MSSQEAPAAKPDVLLILDERPISYVLAKENIDPGFEFTPGEPAKFILGKDPHGFIRFRTRQAQTEAAPYRKAIEADLRKDLFSPNLDEEGEKEVKRHLKELLEGRTLDEPPVRAEVKELFGQPVDSFSLDQALDFEDDLGDDDWLK